ncbi:TPA: hypothetical protein ACPDJ4_000193 [Pasteurella multocida]
MTLINLQLKYAPINKAVNIPLEEIDSDIEGVERLLTQLQFARREHINYHDKNKSHGKETEKVFS